MDAIVEKPPSLASQVGARIRMFRKQRVMTLKQLAYAIGTSPQTMSRLETDQMTLSMDWLEQICAALEIKPSELFGDEGALAEAIEARRIAETRLHVLRSGLERFHDTIKATYSEELG
jgi:transcriptional regulator with XRE-family HTH domain